MASLEDFASALVHLIRETDIVGWHREGQILGAVFTELFAAEKPGSAEKIATVNSIRLRVHSIARERLTKEIAAKLNLQFRFFPGDLALENDSAPWRNEGQPPELPSRTVARGIKRMVDFTGSALALVVLSPLFLVISILIKLTSWGPAFFCQTRIGHHGKQFTFLKFRSMYVDSDAAVHRDYVSHFIAGTADIQESVDHKSSAYKLTHDPRITPFGRFLRKTSLDELPQLINVLKGEMSLVGPRPPLPYECACYELWHLRRITEAKPGITGLWQVSGRSKTTFDEMVRLDLRYAKLWSLILDFKIMLRTFRVVLSGDGAY